METFPLEIISPKRLAFSEEVEGVYVPTQNGMIGILAHHVPLFSLLTEGEIKIVTGKKEYYLAIGGGYMQVTPKGASVLVSDAVHAEEINENEIQKAQLAAREAIKRKVTGDELKQAQMILKRSFVELKVLRHRKRRQSNVPNEL